MHSAEQPHSDAPAPGPIAAAVEASASGLKTRSDLESVLMDASLFGRLAYHALCNLGFESREPPTLDREDNELVYWSVSRLSMMIDEAKATFYEVNAGKRGSP